MTDKTPEGTESLSFSEFVSDLSRRGFLRGSAAAGVGIAGLGSVGAAAQDQEENVETTVQQQERMTVPAILNVALTLERLEATFYNRAVGENGMWDEQMVESSDVAKRFAAPQLRYSTYQHFTDVRDHEAYHVALLEQTLDQLGASVRAPSRFTFPDGVFDSVEEFVKFAVVLEDTGVAAYAGVAPRLVKAELGMVNGEVGRLRIAPAALGIHSIEARHAGYFRTLNQMRPWEFGANVPVEDAAVDDPLPVEQVLARVRPLLGGDGDAGNPGTITFNDQRAEGNTVVVAEASLPQGGFVAIPDSSLSGGDAVGNFVGVSDFLDSGTHRNVRIDIDQQAASGEQTLAAMAHRDTNGNRTFDFVSSGGTNDRPYVDPTDADGDGEVVVLDTATVTF